MKRALPEKPLHWVGSAKDDLLEFPPEVVDDLGYALYLVQIGGKPPMAKPWKGEGPGVFEIVEGTTEARPTGQSIPSGSPKPFTLCTVSSRSPRPESARRGMTSNGSTTA